MNPISSFHNATLQNNSHNSRLPDQPAIRIPTQYRLHQSLLNPVQLYTGVPQSGDLHDRGIADQQSRMSGQVKQVYSGRGDVFAHLAGGDVKTSFIEFIMQFGMDQMHLA